MKYRQYVIGTVAYGIAALAGILGGVYFLLKQQWLLVVVFVLITYVALDNFFCGTHLKKCGMPVTRHYVMPPFLRWKKRN